MPCLKTFGWNKSSGWGEAQGLRSSYIIAHQVPDITADLPVQYCVITAATLSGRTMQPLHSMFTFANTTVSVFTMFWHTTTSMLKDQPPPLR